MKPFTLWCKPEPFTLVNHAREMTLIHWSGNGWNAYHFSFFGAKDYFRYYEIR